MPPKAKALEKAALNQADKDRKAAIEAEKAEEAEWSKGAKDSSKSAAEAEKDAEKRRKAAEKAALLAQEDADASGVKKIAGAKLKKKGKDDFDLLNAALAAAPKTKAQKEADAKKALDEAKKAKEEKARLEKEAKIAAQQEEIRKLAAKGMVMNHTDDLFIPINNHLDEDDYEDISGINGAIDAMKIDGGGKDEHPERRRKAQYAAYYEQQLPIMKEDYPGLKLSQYKDRIFDNWKRSPENPDNQKKSSEASSVWAFESDTYDD